MDDLKESVKFKLPLARERVWWMNQSQREELLDQVCQNLFGCDRLSALDAGDRSTELSYLIVLLGG